ncbi:hypothetical protein GL218_01615 [Daldinia childiae]|uniref:uncharacterized protein n=1 Tax=Daldinia childiae TaxID=326645 RepID=UPI0014453F23|nr:uncharacterized protein GL218_01615 [Daldinia childiae]KAF3064836.1 hypothetical protein GL218_01615 [Daldinia childiae]
MTSATGTSVLLGPLTTTWAPPPACSIAVVGCSTCSYGWQAQTCGELDEVRDEPSCWPPRTLGAPARGQPLFAWGVYSPGLVCPQGYTTACSYNGARKTGDFNFYFNPEESETAIGCCPPGYACSRHSEGQTCITTLTSTTFPTVTCESGTSAHFEYVTIPYIAAGVSTTQVISTFTVLAPLFQLNHQASDLPSTTDKAADSSIVSATSASLSQTSPQQALPTQSSSTQGLSTGAQAGIGCGVALGIIILGVIAFCLFRSRRRKIGPTELESTEQETKFPIEFHEQAPAAVELDGNWTPNIIVAKPRLIHGKKPLRAVKRRARRDRKPMLAVGVAAVRTRLPRSIVDPSSRLAGQVAQRERADRAPVVFALARQRRVVPVADEAELERGVGRCGCAV